MTNDSVYRALLIAIQAHHGQADKSGRPYLEHPVRVMMNFKHPDAQCVALLHDVLEDSDFTPEDLSAEGMSSEVIAAVVAITHLRNEPRVEYYRRVKRNPLALAVKFADIDDNCSPDRLALLDEQTRQRLKEKYRQARLMLATH